MIPTLPQTIMSNSMAPSCSKAILGSPSARARIPQACTASSAQAGDCSEWQVVHAFGSPKSSASRGLGIEIEWSEVR